MFVYNNFFHDTRILKEGRSLVGNGYDVVVIALLDDTTMPLEERDGIKIVRVKNSIKEWITRIVGAFFYIKKRILKFVSRKKNVARRANRLDMVSSDKRLKGLLMPFYKAVHYMFYYMKSYRVAMNHPSDIYQANDLNTLPVAWLVAKRYGAKLVYDSHEFYLEKNRLRPLGCVTRFLLRRIEAFLIQKANAVITVNESIADALSRRYGIKTPTVVMNAPPRTTRLTNGNVNLLREALHIKPDYHLLLYTGLLTFNRGLEKMIESLTYLPDCYLVLMGYGTEMYKRRLLKVARRNGIESRVSFFGPVPSDEVTMYAAGADLGVAPIENSCLSYYYCSPNKVFEYINAGLAVIASDFPELKKVIHQHNIGCTFNPSDPANIARAVRYIFEDAGRWRTMKQNTFAASQCYNWENESEKLLTLYRTLR